MVDHVLGNEIMNNNNQLVWETPEIFDVRPANDVIAQCESSGAGVFFACPGTGVAYTPKPCGSFGTGLS